MRLSLARERRGALFSAFGVAMGVGALVFFIGLGLGVGGVIREKVFPNDARLVDVVRALRPISAGPVYVDPGQGRNLR